MDWGEEPRGQSVVDQMIDDLVMLKQQSKTSKDYILGCLNKISDWLSLEGFKNHIILFKTIRSSFERMIAEEKTVSENSSILTKLQDKLTLSQHRYDALETQSKKQVEEINRLKQALGFTQGKLNPSLPSFMGRDSPPRTTKSRNDDDIRTGNNTKMSANASVSDSDSNSTGNKALISGNKLPRSGSPIFGSGHSAVGRNPFEDPEDSGLEMMNRQRLWEMFGYALHWATEKNWKKEPIIGIKKIQDLYCACCRSKSLFYYHANPHKSLRVMACYNCGNGVSKQVDDDSMDFDRFYKDFVTEVLETKANKSRNTSRKPARR